MTTRAFNTLVTLFVSGVILFSCNQEAKTEKTETDSTAKMNKVSQPDFDASMDATTMQGYPGKVLGDSLGIKVYEFVVNPGDSVLMHSHPDHSIYVVEGGKIAVYHKDGTSQIMDVQPGMAMISAADQHSAKNIGTTTVKLAITHVYRPRN